MNETNDISSSIFIKPYNKMSGKIKIISIGDHTVSSNVNIKNTNNLLSNLQLYSDFVIEDPTWGNTIYGNQRRSNMYVLHRDDLQSNIGIRPKNVMSGIVDVVPPPIIKRSFAVTADAFLRQKVPTLNYGFDQTIMVGYSKDKNEVYKSLIKFEGLSLPEDITIKKATIKLYNTQLINQNISVELFKVSNFWLEGGVTWRNKPEISDYVTESVVDKIGYINFDITSLIEDWYTNQDTQINNGFEIVSKNELIDQIVKFYSRESNSNKPLLEIEYQDNNIPSFGRTTIASNAYILYRNDLKSSFSVRSYNSDKELKTTMFVNRPDTMLSNFRISREQVLSSIKIRNNTGKTLDSNIIVRMNWIDDLDFKMSINRPDLFSYISVLYENDMQSNITVKRNKIYDIDCNIRVSREQLTSGVFVKYRNNINSNIIVQKTEDYKIPSNIKISRDLLYSSIKVNLNNNIDSNITVRRMGIKKINSLLFISRPDLESNIKVNIFKDLESTVYISSGYFKSNMYVKFRNNILSNLTVQTRFIYDIATNIIVRKSSNINSKLTISRSYMSSEISVNLSDSISSSLYVNPSSLKSEINVKFRADLESNMEVKVKFIDDLDSSIIVNIGNVGYVFIM